MKKHEWILFGLLAILIIVTISFGVREKNKETNKNTVQKNPVQVEEITTDESNDLTKNNSIDYLNLNQEVISVDDIENYTLDNNIDIKNAISLIMYGTVDDDNSNQIEDNNENGDINIGGVINIISTGNINGNQMELISTEDISKDDKLELISYGIMVTEHLEQLPKGMVEEILTAASDNPENPRVAAQIVLIQKYPSFFGYIANPNPDGSER